MDLSKTSTFQVIIIAILGVSAIVGFIVFAMYRPSDEASSYVTIWGTVPATTVNQLLEQSVVKNTLKTSGVVVTYVQKGEETIDTELLNAMAIGQGPDAVIMREDQILQYQNRIVSIPYTSLPVRTFRDTFVQAAELYLQPQGIVALPFMIDPLVMYYNRDLLTSANVPAAPQYWSDVLTILPRITVAGINRVITRSTIAFGGYENVNNAKAIISLLLLQAGTPIVSQESSGRYQVQLSQISGTSQNPGDRALSFYTQFADPTKSTYTWNASLQNSRDLFLAGRLALYFGFASELNTLRERNPNLNFDVAVVPQTDSLQTKTTFGHIYGMAILLSSKDQQGAFSALTALAGPTVQAQWSTLSNLPPITRSLLAQAPSDPDQAIFYTAALQARSWIDPNRTQTQTIFSNLVKAIVSGASRPLEAVSGAQYQLQQLFPNI